MKARYDCVIVGGGSAGATLALALAQLQYGVLLIEKETAFPQSDSLLNSRTLALSYASMQIYQQLGVLEQMHPYLTPIQKVRVTVKGQYGSSCLQSNRVRQLGAVIGVADLDRALYDQLSRNEFVDVFRNTTLKDSMQTPTQWLLTVQSQDAITQVKCDLLVASDGVHSSLRAHQKISCQKREYGHYGILTNVQMQDFEPNTAIERFLPLGAIALLPWQQNISTLVWSGNEIDIKANMALDDAAFLDAAQAQLGRRIGKIEKMGKRACFPLQMHLASQQVSARFLLLGNAAHSLHPIAAQGLNLSLRDIWQIRSQLLKNQYDEKPCLTLGDESFLNHYVNERYTDQRNIIFATDKIARYMSGGPIPTQLRALGITLFDFFSPAKNFFTRLGMGL